ncbi:MAG: gliding motility protein GldD [Tannerella sp.]|jgi:gliding motility-associated lipoprotein GldD|nr:gliding motility protein GldD [Tannerella sp.]
MRLLSGICLAICVSCAEYTPKPRGYHRIDLPPAHYRVFASDDLACTFHVSHLAVIELPPQGTAADWMNISYESLNARIYCSIRNVTPQTLSVAEEECRRLLFRNAKDARAIREQSYENQDIRLYGRLFRITGETASPIQFMLTDSLSRFFRGALYYQCRTNVDSLAPVTEYLGNDMVELIQSFRWK